VTAGTITAVVRPSLALAQHRGARQFQGQTTSDKVPFCMPMGKTASNSMLNIASEIHILEMINLFISLTIHVLLVLVMEVGPVLAGYVSSYPFQLHCVAVDCWSAWARPESFRGTKRVTKRGPK
jgi:hypothetical protein